LFYYTPVNEVLLCDCTVQLDSGRQIVAEKGNSRKWELKE